MPPRTATSIVLLPRIRVTGTCSTLGGPSRAERSTTTGPFSQIWALVVRAPSSSTPRVQLSIGAVWGTKVTRMRSTPRCRTNVRGPKAQVGQGLSAALDSERSSMGLAVGGVSVQASSTKAGRRSIPVDRLMADLLVQRRPSKNAAPSKITEAAALV